MFDTETHLRKIHTHETIVLDITLMHVAKKTLPFSFYVYQQIFSILQRKQRLDNNQRRNNCDMGPRKLSWKTESRSSLEVLSCQCTYLGVKMRRCDARTRQIQGIQKNLHEQTKKKTSMMVMQQRLCCYGATKSRQRQQLQIYQNK